MLHQVREARLRSQRITPVGSILVKMARQNTEKELLELIVRDGQGYGDPDARLNDDRKVQILLGQQQIRMASRLNVLTALLVIVGLLNICALLVQLFRK